MQHEIFISYAREDRGRVQLIAQELSRRGHQVWWDTGLRGGENYRDRIEEALETARCVVVAWSAHSVESEFVIDEASRGQRRKILLPVFLDPGIDPPLGFGSTHAIDLSGWLADPSHTESFDAFAADVAALLGRAPEPARPPAVPSAGARRPGSAAGRNPRHLVMGAAGAAALVLAAVLYAAVDRDPDPPRAVPGGDTVSHLATNAPAARPVSSAEAAAVLRGLRCTLPGRSRNPINERAQRSAPPTLSVDTALHLLVGADGRPVPTVQAANVGTALVSRRLIVAHATATLPGQAETIFEDGQFQASAHVLIAPDGTFKQLVPFDIRAFHAGQSQWKDIRGLNSHSLGIELENRGMLGRQGSGWVAQGRPVPEDEVEVVDGRGWHRYTDAQIRAFFQVSCALRRAYPTLEDVAGHEHIAPGRKPDPGPAFPFEAMRSRLFPEQP